MDITDEDRKQAKEALKQAAKIASKFGPQIYEAADGPRQAIIALSIIMSAIARGSDVSMHSLMGVVMEVYKQTARFEEESL